jgi:hypothetical protein
LDRASFACSISPRCKPSVTAATWPSVSGGGASREAAAGLAPIVGSVPCAVDPGVAGLAGAGGGVAAGGVPVCAGELAGTGFGVACEGASFRQAAAVTRSAGAQVSISLENVMVISETASNVRALQPS